ncbi:hypothetical protein LCGC14_2230930, partial [marine sediment metagenome]
FTPGQILTGSPPRVTTNPFARIYTFATTETQFLTGGSQKITSVRLESDVTTAKASQQMAAYQVVKWSSFGTVAPANYNDTTSTTIGILTDNVSVDNVTSVLIQGVIQNEAWNFTTVGAELFILADGTLTESDPNVTNPTLYPVSKPPVARVLSAKEIIFMQGLGKVGPRGLNPASIGSIDDVTLTQPITLGDVIRFSGSPELWQNSRSLIDELADVTITSAVAGDILYNDGTNWVNLARGTATQILTMGSPLIPKWVTNPGLGSPIGSNILFGDLQDVDLLGAIEGDLLFRSSDNWIDTNGLLTWLSGTLTVTGALEMADASGPTVLNLSATGTVPTLIPDRSDPNTGIGHGSPGGDILSLIAGGQEIARYSTSGIDTRGSDIINTGSPTTLSVSTPGLLTLTNDGTSNITINNGDISIGTTGGPADTIDISTAGMSSNITLSTNNTGASISLLVLDSGNIILTSGGSINMETSQTIRLGSVGSPNQISTPPKSGLIAVNGLGSPRANPLTASYNVFSTVDANTAIALPGVFIVGVQCHIKNDGANTLTIFPVLGDDLGQGVDASTTLASGSSAFFLATTAWIPGPGVWTQMY